MRFGLNFFPSFRLSDMSTAEYFSLALGLSERADQLGYSSVKTVEHYFHDYGGHSPNPIVLLSAIAARTKRIRLITGAVIPAFNNPIKLAGELAMLDNISNGRLDAGFGRAFIPKEFDVFNVSMDESRPLFEEGIDIITRLWTERRESHRTTIVIGLVSFDRLWYLTSSWLRVCPGCMEFGCFLLADRVNSTRLPSSRCSPATLDRPE